MKISEYPIHLEIESTNRCNLECVMCPHRLMRRPQVDMEWETFKKIIDESRGRSKSCYLHMIGEPLLHDGIIDMIDYTQDACIDTSISTNCMLLDESMSKRLLSSKLRELILCLDATNKETYQKLRKGGDFLQVKNNIDAFIKMRKASKSSIIIVLQLIHMKCNSEHIQRLKNLYESRLFGIGYVLIKEYSTFASFVPDLNAKKTKPRRTWCSKLRTHIAFHSDGDCVICCRDFDKFTVIGNINNSSIEKLWKSDKYDEYRAEFDMKSWTNFLCKDC